MLVGQWGLIFFVYNFSSPLYVWLVLFSFCWFIWGGLGGAFCSAVLGICPAIYVEGDKIPADIWSRFRSEGFKAISQQLPALFAVLH